MRTVVVAVRARTGEMAAANTGRRAVSILSDVLVVLVIIKTESEDSSSLYTLSN